MSLSDFENRFQFLYDIKVNGVPVYTCLRDGVAVCLLDGKSGNAVQSSVKSRVFFKRIIDSVKGIRKNNGRKTLIFTSSMYRRDYGRNLACEYLLERYPDAVVFEWPSRSDKYDTGYVSDPLREKYCPLDWYLVLKKLYSLMKRGYRLEMECKCREMLESTFAEYEGELTSNEKCAVEYIIDKLPEAYAETVLSQNLFKWIFRKYRNVDTVVDFWGAARENIIPVLGDVKSVELQHGIITSIHPGYIYQDFVRNLDTAFFDREILVYGEKTKEILTKDSIFSPEQITVIGNPRIEMYQKVFSVEKKERKLILFTSQPYEQDGAGNEYYSTVIPVLKRIQEYITKDSRWDGYSLGVKLHPREDNGVTSLYKEALSDVEVYDNASQLYELLSMSYVQVTVTSTSLYEAAIFDCPTVCIRYGDVDLNDIYGFEPWMIDDECSVFERLRDEGEYTEYLKYLKEETRKCM